MSDWRGGYVSDVPYVTGWYRHQSPAQIALACLLNGVAVAMPGDDAPISYLELGCGHGFGALLLAASNPTWRVTAIDFLPAHIAEARQFAADAQLTNVRFIEADLAILADDPAVLRVIPEADFVSLHGVWSWVGPAARAGIVRLLRARVRSGGAVHVSYNVLPGWSSALGLQRVLREAGRTMAWRSDDQAAAGLQVAQALHEAGAAHLHGEKLVGLMLQGLGAQPAAYLAHEFMHDTWEPCWHSDVAVALSDARLEWIASGELLENFPEITLNEAQRVVLRRFTDPRLRELVKDVCLDRPLRHDVFVRGARRMSPAARDTALRDVSLVALTAPDELPGEVTVPAGRLALDAAMYRPVVAAIQDAPRRVAELMDLPDLPSVPNAAELSGMLVGLSLAEVALRPKAGPGDAARRFNTIAARRRMANEQSSRGTGIASVRLGAGLPASLLDMLVLDRVARGEHDVEAWYRALAGPAPTDDGEGLRDALMAAQRRLPRLRAAGVV